MTAEPFVSYAQNGEDVVLWRALHTIASGTYVEVGANHPTDFSVSRAFYDRGWSGVCVEPVAGFAHLLREARPRDVVVEAAVVDSDESTVTLHVIDDTGLSTVVQSVGREHGSAGWPVRDVVVPALRLDQILAEHVTGDIHFLLVDVEGAEEQVLRSVDLEKWRPWVIVVEATAPMSNHPTHSSWEPRLLDAGYDFCLFDGLSRFYVAQEHRDELARSLAYPACVLDAYVPRRTFELQQQLRARDLERDQLNAEIVRWRGQVLERWAQATATALSMPGAGGVSTHEAARLRAELEQVHRTLSWRVTKPLRTVRAAQLRRSVRR